MPQTVLITGSSTGIGAATAELFFQRGWNVVATQRSPRGLRQDPRWLELRLDVTEADSISSALAAAISHYGHLDAVVNNAGYGLVGSFESMSEEQIERQFATNVFGLMRVCRAALPHFRSLHDGRGGGVLINVASMGGRLTFPFYSVYHASKWAVEGFSESLAFEAETVGVQVKIVEPGAIKTDFYERSMDFVHDRSLVAYNAAVERGMKKMSKAGAKGAPASQVAEAIWNAATDGSKRLRYVVGSDAKSLLALRRLLGIDTLRGILKGQLLK
ncbi:MAG: SDR family oxidoreductase [Stagnimonas sp.]|nr:SDR family oxidoreductase [Stagnimonas sp.]